MTNPSILATPGGARAVAREEFFEFPETRDLVALVNDAGDLIRDKGERVFDEFREPESRWRSGEKYVFVLDLEGNMLVHSDPGMEGKNQLELKDIDGRPIIRGLLDVASAVPGKPEGWYHYQWPVPGGLLPRWKTSFVRRVSAPSGKDYVVGSGVYNDRMERAFVVDAVKNAVAEVETRGTAAFPLFRDPTGPYLAKDAYIFVLEMNGVELVNPAHPNLEGTNLIDRKDTQGKYLIRELIQVVRNQDSGWVDYMWPKPGESVSTQKSAFVSKAKLGDRNVVVGCGVYLADAPKSARPIGKMTAPELMRLVREAAAVFAEKGEGAFADFRRKSSKWFHDDTYFFAWTMDGIRAFHAPKPEIEGENVADLTDVIGRQFGKMILEAGASPAGEGWIHYMYPQPEDIFPTWKSTFVKRVTFPSGKQHIIGCGIYQMQMNETFIEDVVSHAAALIEQKGKDAFSQLRDKKGPFVFMDTYVFVVTVDGFELVNPAQPSLEGRNLMELTDLRGKTVVKDEIATALEEGSAWRDGYWFRPGDNKPALKKTFVRKVRAGADTFVIGSGIYVE
jgi:signal transduction histidine kinase